MRAARLERLGDPPRLGESTEPTRAAGQATLELRAVALNPLDVAIGSGRFYGGSPALPYTPGCEGVGRVVEGDALEHGARVYVWGDGMGVKRDGTLAERVAVSEELAFRVPDGVADEIAVACGIAGVAGWVAVTRRARVTEDDRVLVLGATGTVGNVALQAARVCGAEIVIAAGRRADRLERALQLGADAVVRLGESFAEDLADTFAGEGPTVIIDPLWGEPLRAALEAAAPGARAVNLGQSAGAETTLSSAVVRGKQLEILGHSNFALSGRAYEEAYLELVEHVGAGRVHIDLERFPLEEVEAAWRLQQSEGGGKAVVTMERPGPPGPGA